MENLENNKVTHAMRIRTFGRQIDKLWVSAGTGNDQGFAGTPTLLTMESDDVGEVRVIDPSNPDIVHVYTITLNYEGSVT